jgi:recombination protein RecR
MDSINKLVQFFSEFPGIGPRQAKRFVYFLLTRPQNYLDDISVLIKDIRKNIRTCTSCFRFFTVNAANSPLCPICRDDSRDSSTLMLVARDVDLETIERSKSYNGYYFVLGGTIPILDKSPETKIRQKELLKTIEVKKSQGLSEIILAMNANADGENTADYLKSLLSPFADLKVSILGRGLSTGTELEYSDGDTIKNALKNRA